MYAASQFPALRVFSSIYIGELQQAQSQQDSLAQSWPGSLAKLSRTLWFYQCLSAIIEADQQRYDQCLQISTKTECIHG